MSPGFSHFILKEPIKPFCLLRLTPMLLLHHLQAAAAKTLINKFLFIFPLMRDGINCNSVVFMFRAFYIEQYIDTFVYTVFTVPCVSCSLFILLDLFYLFFILCHCTVLTITIAFHCCCVCCCVCILIKANSDWRRPSGFTLTEREFTTLCYWIFFPPKLNLSGCRLNYCTFQKYLRVSRNLFHHPNLGCEPIKLWLRQSTTGRKSTRRLQHASVRAATTAVRQHLSRLR